jgi:hypothetical protein
MAKITFGTHSSVLVPRQDRDSIRKFYCDVLGGKIMKADPERDFIRLGEDFYIGFLYGDVADESEFLRSARSIWLEIGFRLWAPESLVPTSGSDQTTARFGVENHPPASAPTSAPSDSPCNRSEVSSATLL